MRSRVRCAALACCAAAAAVPAAAAEDGAPFRIRNLNPLVAVFGLPAWETVAPGTRLGVAVEVANHYRLSVRGGERLILDGETARTTFSVTHGFDNGWQVGLDLPHYRLSGGHLDDLIDSWHSAFGMPDGGRNNRPEDELFFELANRRGSFLMIDERTSGIGDVQLRVARALGRDGELVLQGTLKLPTGDEDVLAGSGSADAAVSLFKLSPFTVGERSASFFWGAGALHVGDADRIAFAGESFVYTGIVGAALQVRPRFGIKGQVDYHSPFFDSPLEEIGEAAIQATVGAWFRPNRRALYEFAVVEDLEVSTAPDIVLHVAAQWSW